MAQPMLASAVVLPGASPSPSPPRAPTPARHPSLPQAQSPTSPAPGGIKRRPSSASSQTASRNSPKRQRLSPSETPNDTSANQPPPPSKVPGAAPVDQKKRSQRLFGALLGGVGQSRPSNSAAAKRRAEQEERRRNDLRKREQELGERQRLRLERLTVARAIAQRKVDELNMRSRHQNMKDMANFLSTTTEPKLYFKPWELLPEQEDLIARQREDVEDQIDRELDEFDQTKEVWRQEDGKSSKDQQPSVESDQAANGHLRSTDKDTQDSPVPTPNDLSEPQEQSVNRSVTDTDNEPHRKDSIDDTGDIVVEADEDTVIY